MPAATVPHVHEEPVTPLRQPPRRLCLRLQPPRHARPVPGMWDARRRLYYGMKRRLLNLLTALSLLLFVSACVLWARSYVAADYWYRETWDGRRAAEMELQSYQGRLRLQYQTQWRRAREPGNNTGWRHTRFTASGWASEN